MSAPTGLAPYESDIVSVTKNSKKLQILNIKNNKVKSEILLPQGANGLAIKGDIAYVLCGEAQGDLVVIDLKNHRILHKIPVGHYPLAPLIVGNQLYIANRFANTIKVINLEHFNIEHTYRVGREPFAMTATKDGKELWIAHLLPDMKANGDMIAASISKIDLPTGCIKNYPLTNGTQTIRDIQLSPDENHLVVSHLLSRYEVPTSQVDRGWINTNAITIIPRATPESQYPIILDDAEMGAANPWGIRFSQDGKNLLILHAGTQEISIIPWDQLGEKIQKKLSDKETTDELGFISSIRQRIELPLNGPRSLFVDEKGHVYVSGYYSGNVVSFNINQPITSQDFQIIALEPDEKLDIGFEGERYFNDASQCFQKWQSCISCHPDARVDALNWDMLNDGLGNPKNTRSMFLSHQLPPVMTLGVRKDAETAVRAGFRHIQFMVPDPDICNKVDYYLSHLQAMPSPKLNQAQLENLELDQASCNQCHDPQLKRGILSDNAKLGKKIFKKAGCAECHPHPYFTNKKMVDVGTLMGLDTGKKIQVPTLMESWRTAPYFHDGRAATIREVILEHNPNDQRGNTSSLKQNELEQLIEYVESL